MCKNCLRARATSGVSWTGWGATLYEKDVFTLAYLSSFILSVFESDASESSAKVLECSRLVVVDDVW